MALPGGVTQSFPSLVVAVVAIIAPLGTDDVNDLLRISGLIWLYATAGMFLSVSIGIYFMAAAAPGLALLVLANRLSRRRARSRPDDGLGRQP